MKKFIVIAIVFIAAIIGLLFYLGVFYPIKLKEQAVGDYWVVYQASVGPYENVGPAMNKICQNLKDDGIETKLSFGVYYDDPKKVDKAKLRSEVGAILDEKYYNRIESLRSKYNIKQLKKRNSLVSEFPLRNDLSYMLGPMKVYPAMDNYCKEKDINIENIKDGFGLEIYDMENKKITYILPIE